jgi:peptidoglycan/LPS O-acetylase OafA/YrhL
VSLKREAAGTLKGSIRDAVKRDAKKLFPGYFALVMATGIVSIGTC